MYITKENLIKELREINSKLNKKPVRPVAFTLVCIGFILTLFLLTPIIFVWILLVILYIPGFLLDNFIIYIKGKLK